MTIDRNRPTVVATLRTEMEAAMVANYLVSEGIQARIAGSSSRGGYSACQLEIQVAVRESDLEHARNLLAEKRSTVPHAQPQFRLGAWCLFLAVLALSMATETTVSVLPVLMLFGFVIWTGTWRLIERRRELLVTDDE